MKSNSAAMDPPPERPSNTPSPRPPPRSGEGEKDRLCSPSPSRGGGGGEGFPDARCESSGRAAGIRAGGAAARSEGLEELDQGFFLLVEQFGAVGVALVLHE